jgi:hypothetical protein
MARREHHGVSESETQTMATLDQPYPLHRAMPLSGGASEAHARIRSAIDRVSLERKTIRIVLSDAFELRSGAENKVGSGIARS